MVVVSLARLEIVEQVLYPHGPLTVRGYDHALSPPDSALGRWRVIGSFVSRSVQ